MEIAVETKQYIIIFVECIMKKKLYELACDFMVNFIVTCDVLNIFEIAIAEF